jgi:hypothetical protein
LSYLQDIKNGLFNLTLQAATMKNQLKMKVLVAVIGLSAGSAQAAAITPGDLVVYRVGSGSALTSGTSTAVFLDEYTTSGSLVQSLAMPTTSSGSTNALTASSTASSEGELTISPNGQYLALTGYNAVPGTASIAGTASATTTRTVGIVNVATGNIDTSTALTDFSTGNNPRSAVTTDGNSIWIAGAAGGVRYTTLGATTSTQLSTTVTNIRQLEIFNGQLYSSDSTGTLPTSIRLGMVGSGLPTTTGQTITNLPGVPNSSGSPYSFFFAHLNGAGSTLDTLYIADDGIGITKYSLESGTWVAKGTVGAASDTYRGLTGYVNGSTVNLFATGLGGTTTTGGGKLVSLTDSSGYDQTLTGTPTTLATAATNDSFRGVVLVPAAATAVPVPGAFWLFATGLFGVFGLKRRKA